MILALLKKIIIGATRIDYLLNNKKSAILHA
jgi:hypothetical protein